MIGWQLGWVLLHFYWKQIIRWFVIQLLSYSLSHFLRHEKACLNKWLLNYVCYSFTWKKLISYYILKKDLENRNINFSKCFPIWYFFLSLHTLNLFLSKTLSWRFNSCNLHQAYLAGKISHCPTASEIRLPPVKIKPGYTYSSNKC